MNAFEFSISSHITSYLTTFRNLDGAEENWPVIAPQQRVIPYSFYMKAAVTEVGFGLMVIVAIVEMVVYGFFATVLCPSLFSRQRNLFTQTCCFFVELTGSAYSTIIWTVDNLFKNFKEPNLPSYEQMAGPSTRRAFLHIKQLDAQIAQYRAQSAQYQAQSAQHRARINALQAQNISPQVPANIEMEADLKLLKTILERPENQALVNDLQNEQSCEAFQLLAFLVIVECILTGANDLNFLCTAAQNALRNLHQQDPDFKDKVENFLRIHPHFLTGNPQDFDQIEVDKLEEDISPIFRKIKAISLLALQGSSLFGVSLAEYLDEPE